MRQVIASVGFGMLVFAVWFSIIIYSAPDFFHEGPNTVWHAPINWWGSILHWIGISRLNRLLGRTSQEILIFPQLFGPFIALFSFISYFVLRTIARRSRTAMP